MEDRWTIDQQETTRVVMERRIGCVPMEVAIGVDRCRGKDRTTLSMNRCGGLINKVRRSNRLHAEGLKEGIGYMPMDGWNVSMSTIDAE